MKITTWNVNSLTARLQHVLDWLAANPVDVLVLTEVYPAGEAPIAGADGKSLARAVRARGRIDPVLVKGARDLPGALAPLLRAAMNQHQVSAELYLGPWTDVGTPERLQWLNQTPFPAQHTAP